MRSKLSAPHTSFGGFLLMPYMKLTSGELFLFQDAIFTPSIDLLFMAKRPKEFPKKVERTSNSARAKSRWCTKPRLADSIGAFFFSP